ncbi:PDZK1-interacting protein 1 isoform X2 [Mobula hypostoma]|uniref:PDZK1-interacting protein 1 isoform X2 n=1 Tax=Mobula hypostoma TaxID=723540 RepID=UPI002FC3C838
MSWMVGTLKDGRRLPEAPLELRKCQVEEVWWTDTELDPQECQISASVHPGSDKVHSESGVRLKPAMFHSLRFCCIFLAFVSVHAQNGETKEQPRKGLQPWLTGIIAVVVFLCLCFVGFIVNKIWCKNAERAVLLKWKDIVPPTHAQWLRDVMSCLNLEKICCSISDSNQDFQTRWGPFLNYFRNL